MAITKDSVVNLVSSLKFPGSAATLAEAGISVKCAHCDSLVSVVLSGTSISVDQQPALRKAIVGAIRSMPGGSDLDRVDVDFTARSSPTAASPTAAPSNSSRPSNVAQPQQSPGQQTAPTLPGVKHVIAVGAGKGGVGKSTVAVNIAVGLAQRGHAVGLMDGDIYGPSMPTMLGLDGLQANLMGNMLQPFYVHGVKSMTIGKLVDSEKPLIWRGPMAHGAFKQLVEQTTWGELDYLIIDLPPGTGDVALTMAQLLKLTGAVVVCTPQKVAQDDAIRALRMFQQLNIEVLGIVENMSYFIGDDGKEYDIFGRGGAQQMAQRTGLPFLGAIPITMKLRENSDAGNPSANFQGSTPLAQSLNALVKNLEGQVALSSLRTTSAGPTLTIS